MPGVPDVYQGCEIVMLSLVDPDNRRPVDWTDRGERLERVLADEPAFDLDDEKLRVTARALRLRRDLPGRVRRRGHDVRRAAPRRASTRSPSPAATPTDRGSSPW